MKAPALKLPDSFHRLRLWNTNPLAVLVHHLYVLRELVERHPDRNATDEHERRP
jgi:hypothetical protein